MEKNDRNAREMVGAIAVSIRIEDEIKRISKDKSYQALQVICSEFEAWDSEVPDEIASKIKQHIVLIVKEIERVKELVSAVTSNPGLRSCVPGMVNIEAKKRMPDLALLQDLYGKD
jgi:hypothetical protein